MSEWRVGDQLATVVGGQEVTCTVVQVSWRWWWPTRYRVTYELDLYSAGWDRVLTRSMKVAWRRGNRLWVQR